MARPSSSSLSLFQLASKNDAKRKLQIEHQDALDDSRFSNESLEKTDYDSELKQIREKYVLQNKSLARSNSIMVSRINEMEARISELVNENVIIKRNELELRRQMAAQLDIMQETVSSNVELMMQTLKTLRETYCLGVEMGPSRGILLTAPQRIAKAPILLEFASKKTIQGQKSEEFTHQQFPREETAQAQAPERLAWNSAQVVPAPAQFLLDTPSLQDLATSKFELSPAQVASTPVPCSKPTADVTPSGSLSLQPTQKSISAKSPVKVESEPELKTTTKGKKRKYVRTNHKQAGPSAIALGDGSAAKKSKLEPTETHVIRLAVAAATNKASDKNVPDKNLFETRQESKSKSPETEAELSSASRRSRRLSYKVDYKAPKLNTKIRRASERMIDAVTDNYNYFKPAIKLEKETAEGDEDKENSSAHTKATTGKRTPLASLEVNMNYGHAKDKRLHEITRRSLHNH